MTGDVVGAPPPRSFGSLAADTATGQMLLFGGISANGTYLRDTWMFGNGSWVSLTPAHLFLKPDYPSARYGAALAFDPAIGDFVLFGGHGAVGPTNDTWVFAGRAWVQLAPPTSPSPRTGSALGWDATDGTLVLYGGRNPLGALNDTWQFTGATWTNISRSLTSSVVPSPRYGTGLVPAPGGGLLLFGGASIVQGNSTPLSDTWTFSGRQWVQINVTVSPAGRYFAGLSTTPNGTADLLIGGIGPQNHTLGDVWEWNGTAWAEVNTSVAPEPSPRYGAAVATGPWEPGAYPVLLLFGGDGMNGAPLADSWGFGTLPLIVGTVVATPPKDDLTDAVNFSVTAFGGVAPLSYTWPILPYGCVSENVARLACTPQRSGPQEAEVNVTDSGNASRMAYTQNFSVAPLPLIASFYVTPNPVVVSHPILIHLNVTGGSVPFFLNWSGLPPGCTGRGGAWSETNVSSSEELCSPNATGSDTIQVVLTDAANVSRVATAGALAVVAAPPASFGGWLVTVLVVLTVVAAVVVFVFVWRNRRRPS